MVSAKARTMVIPAKAGIQDNTDGRTSADQGHPGEGRDPEEFPSPAGRGAGVKGGRDMSEFPSPVAERHPLPGGKGIHND